MINEKAPFDSENNNENVVLKKNVSYEDLKILDELYNNESMILCSYCGSSTEMNRKNYVTCVSCGMYVSEI